MTVWAYSLGGALFAARVSNYSGRCVTVRRSGGKWYVKVSE